MHIDNNIFSLYIKFSFNYKRTYDNPIWKVQRKIYLFWCKQINNCYNLYYKLKGKQIVDPLIRYQLQRLLDSSDYENKVLGISLLINYSAGNDLLRHCLYRMYTDRWDKEKGNYKEYHKIGNIQLSENTKIQELIDELREVYLSIPSGTSPIEIIFKCSPYLTPIGYWMFYHSRIGSQCCSSLGEFEHCGNPYQSGRKEVNLIHNFNSFSNKIYTWDWRRHTYDYPVDADEYWKTHEKPDLSVL